MDALQQLERLWEHSLWADLALYVAIETCSDLTEVWREYGHVLAVEELWLSRLTRRRSSVPVWPTLSAEETRALRAHIADGYARYLGALTPGALSDSIPYTNSAGDAFASTIGDILLQMLLHGQYHRGKINLLLKQNDCAPEPVDYIGFVRGSPAAVTPVDGGGIDQQPRNPESRSSREKSPRAGPRGGSSASSAG